RRSTTTTRTASGSRSPRRLNQSPKLTGRARPATSEGKRHEAAGSLAPVVRPPEGRCHESADGVGSRNRTDEAIHTRTGCHPEAKFGGSMRKLQVVRDGAFRRNPRLRAAIDSIMASSFVDEVGRLESVLDRCDTLYLSLDGRGEVSCFFLVA